MKFDVKQLAELSLGFKDVFHVGNCVVHSSAATHGKTANLKILIFSCRIVVPVFLTYNSRI